MSQWSKQKVDASEINNGNEYDVNDALSLDAINAIVNNSLYASEYVSNKITIQINALSSGTITQEQSTALTEDNVIVTETIDSFNYIYDKHYTYGNGNAIVYYLDLSNGSSFEVTFNITNLTWSKLTRQITNSGIQGTTTSGQVLTSDGNNGTEWTTLEVSGGVTSIGGVTGDITLGNGLSIENNQLSATNEQNGQITIEDLQSMLIGSDNVIVEANEDNSKIVIELDQTFINNLATNNDIDVLNKNITSKIETIQNNVDNCLVKPSTTPSDTKLVAVDNTNTQTMVTIGDGLIVENNTLKSTGGGSGTQLYKHQITSTLHIISTQSVAYTDIGDISSDYGIIGIYYNNSGIPVNTMYWCDGPTMVVYYYSGLNASRVELNSETITEIDSYSPTLLG